MDPSQNADRQLEALVEQYGALIGSVVRKIAGRDAATLGDDVEQRVIVSLWRRLAAEQPIEYPASYLYRMAVRETVRTVREYRQNHPLSLDAAPQDPPDYRNPHTSLQARETRAAIRAGLKVLRPDRRRAVNQHLAGRSVAEIMAAHGWSYQRARNLIARGLSDLRHSLREYRA